jgi:hypothetical protein
MMSHTGNGYPGYAINISVAFQVIQIYPFPMADFETIG